MVETKIINYTFHTDKSCTNAFIKMHRFPLLTDILVLLILSETQHIRTTPLIKFKRTIQFDLKICKLYIYIYI